MPPASEVGEAEAPIDDTELESEPILKVSPLLETIVVCEIPDPSELDKAPAPVEDDKPPMGNAVSDDLVVVISVVLKPIAMVGEEDPKDWMVLLVAVEAPTFDEIEDCPPGTAVLREGMGTPELPVAPVVTVGALPDGEPTTDEGDPTP